MNAQPQQVLDFSRQSANYYNTTSYAGTDLAERKARVATQNAIVMGLFTIHVELTPSETERHLIARGLHWEITSIRRAITTLTDAKQLVKLQTKRQGTRGAQEHVWSLPAKGLAA